MDSPATSNFGRIEYDFKSTGEKSKKLVAMPNEQIDEATHKAMLPITQLNNDAREIDILTALKSNSLISVGKLADAGYTTVFHPEDRGVTGHRGKDIATKVFKEAIL